MHSQPSLPFISISRTAAACARGFTSIELLVVIGIIAVLASLAVPSFTPLVERWRVRQAAEELASTIHYARSEAIKRAGNVSITKLDNGGVCTMASKDSDWGCGWQVSSGGDILQDIAAPTRIEIMLTDSTGAISVDRWGMLAHSDGTATPTAMNFQLTPQGKSFDAEGAIRLCISLSGRVTHKKGGESC